MQDVYSVDISLSRGLNDAAVQINADVLGELEAAAAADHLLRK